MTKTTPPPPSVLDRASKIAPLVGVGLACTLAAMGIATASGSNDRRLDALEKSDEVSRTDHDRIVRMDANLVWMMRAMGGDPK